MTFLATMLMATDTVRDGALLVAIPIAFAAGIVSFLSPCVLPLVPVYLSYITGMSATDLAEAAAPIAAPVAGEADVPGPSIAQGVVGVQTQPEIGVAATEHPAFHPVRRVVLGSLGFVLGTAVVFVSFGALFGSFGRVAGARRRTVPDLRGRHHCVGARPGWRVGPRPVGATRHAHPSITR